MSVEFKVVGVEDLKKELEKIPHEMRFKLLLPALRAGGTIVRNEARRRAPVLSATSTKGMFKRGTVSLVKYRRPGTLRKAISVRTSKDDKARGDVGVFINVKPLGTSKGSIKKFGKRGAKNPNDPFYWSFIEFGWNPAGAEFGGWRGAAGKRYRRKLSRAGGKTKIDGKRYLRDSIEYLRGPCLEKIKSVLAKSVPKLNKGTP